MMPTSGAAVISSAEARRELAKRELARRHLVDFSEYMLPWYHAAAHHRLVAEYLEQVELYIRTGGKNGVGRLLILEPPRHGKSEQVSRHFPAWLLGRLPDSRIILTSYGADLAQSHSRAARELVMSERYQAVFGEMASTETPVALADDSRSVGSWDLAAPHRGGVVAAGVGGGIVGKGAHLLIVDDPFRNRAEVESEELRNRVWDWWTASAYTRLEQGGAVVGMLQRWHADDWAGRLLKAMASNDPLADHWVVLSLPAIWYPPSPPADTDFDAWQLEQLRQGVWVEREDPLGRAPGAALWPQKYDAADLARKKANMGVYDFEALYQQQPYLRSGSMFQREWFTVVDTPPDPKAIRARVRYWDKAGTKTGQGGDFAVGVLMCITNSDQVYVEHVSRGRYTPGQREDAIVRIGKEDMQRPGPKTVIWHQQDPGSAGLDSAQATNRRLASVGLVAHYEPVSGDKIVRAGPWSSACEGGQVRLVRAAWNQDFIEEHVAFPLGPYDDQVDTSSTAYSKLTGRAARRREPRSYQG